jgi:hypothetical protein
MCCLLNDYLLSFFIYFFHIYLWFFLVSWTNISFTLGNDFEPGGWDLWFFIKNLLFCSTTRRHDINFEYLLKLHSSYCCYITIFKAWKEENKFSNIWFYVIFLPQNFSCEVILKRIELYSLTDFKSLQPQVQIITSLRKYDKLLVVISFLYILP